MPPELAEWIPPAVIIAVMFYLHRVTRQDIRQMEERLGSRISKLESHNDELRGEDSKLRERMARVEGQLEQGLRYPRPPYSPVIPTENTTQDTKTSKEKEYGNERAANRH